MRFTQFCPEQNATASKPFCDALPESVLPLRTHWRLYTSYMYEEKLLKLFMNALFGQVNGKYQRPLIILPSLVNTMPLNSIATKIIHVRVHV